MAEGILQLEHAFGSYSVNELQAAKKFYGETLGIDVEEQKEGLALTLGGANFFLYPKRDHAPANFTVLNIPTHDIEAAVAELRSRGVKFESYSGDIETDDSGIFRGAEKGQGPNIAWFKDPAGNIISVVQPN